MRGQKDGERRAFTCVWCTGISGGYAYFEAERTVGMVVGQDCGWRGKGSVSAFCTRGVAQAAFAAHFVWQDVV